MRYPSARRTRYVPVARPDFISRWFAEGLTAAALARAPTLTYNDKDRVQIEWAALASGTKVVPPTHILPSPNALRMGALAGLGWVMLPVRMAAPELAAGRLRLLAENLPIDVALTWQVNRSLRSILAPMIRAVRRAAAEALLPMPPRWGECAEDQ